MVCHLSQPDALSTCFMEGFYICIATFALLIVRILLCLHMKINSVFEIVMYKDQINICICVINQLWLEIFRINEPMLMVLQRYSSIDITPFQCLFVREGPNLASKFTAKHIFDRVLLSRCISTLIALRYGVSSPRSSSSFSWDQNESSFISSDLIIIGVINECE